MTMSSRIRRVAAIAATALALGAGGLAATPAHAQTQPQPSSDLASSSPNSNPAPVYCVYDPHNTAVLFYPYLLPITPRVTAYFITVGDLVMTPGGYVTCYWTNGITEKLTLQGDGNFVFYVNNGKTWAPHPAIRTGVKASFQGDGNLTVENSTGHAIWASKTNGKTDAILAFQDDGNLVIYPSTANFTAAWATNTA
jgi:hypothetical protein